MKTVNHIPELKEILNQKRQHGTIGFVPTMGALHDGHISLIKESVANNTYTVASIFVNPTQFNDKKDLDRYPRNLDADCKMLAQAGCNLVFAPTVEEMYPEPDTRKFNFGTLETVMEGRQRPGHFNGVGQIVSKLFDAVEPDKSYFGLKDFQQLAIIKKLVKDFDYNIEIVPCPIIREKDGLAMSSRNTLLEPEKREAAPFIHRILKEAANMRKNFSPGEIKEKVSQAFVMNDELVLEYFEIVDDETLQPIPDFFTEKPCTACIAVFAGKIRLIDNIQIIL